MPSAETNHGVTPLSDTDVDRIATRILEKLLLRLQTPQSAPPAVPIAKTNDLPAKLTYSLAELSIELGVSKVTLYRLEARGLLKSLPYLRTKVYSRKEVERFLDIAGKRTP